MIELETLIGKPIVLLDKQGRKRPVGTITRAHADKHGISITGSVTDAALAAAIDKDTSKTAKVGG